MSTGFQPNAFQPSAFQQYGGVDGTDVVVNINATQEGDSGSIRMYVQQRNAGAAGGRRHRYVVYVNGKRYIGYQEEIYSILETMAEADAEVAITGEKPPKRRIVVQPGKEQPRQIGSTKVETKPLTVDLKPIQQDFRRVYLAKLAHEVLEADRDDEEILMMVANHEQEILRELMDRLRGLLTA